MTVKEVFELRKQGRVEEAYAAIRPMYAVHKGHYTTLCMFWTASDMFKLRMEQGHRDEAEKIYLAMKRMLSTVDDKDGKAAGFMQYAERRLADRRSKRQVEPVKEKATAAEEAVQEMKPDREALELNTESEKSPSGTGVPSEPDHPAAEVHRLFDTEFTTDDPTGHPVVGVDEGVTRNVDVLNAPQRVVLACVAAHEGYSVSGIATSTGIPAKSVERHVTVLIEKGFIEHRSSKKTGGYFLVGDAKRV